MRKRVAYDYAIDYLLQAERVLRRAGVAKDSEEMLGIGNAIATLEEELYHVAMEEEAAKDSF
jgi:predicted O-methyltransferase YrrM